MPSIITHYLHGRLTAFKNITDLKKVIAENYQEFLIGTNGPDLFFYYYAFPWTTKKNANQVQKIGSMIHKEDVNRFFEIVFKTVKREKNDKITAYVCGLLCHWALDKTAHPYIFYYTGEPDVEIYSYYHRLFETTLDAIMLKRIKNQTISEFKDCGIVSYKKESVDAIYQVYQDSVKQVYGFDLEQKTVRTCLKHFYIIRKLLQDKKGRKKKIFGKIERWMKKPYMITSMIVPAETTDLYDIMNEERETWLHPVTHKASQESFMELFAAAAKLANEELNQLDHYLKDKISIEEMVHSIQNENFETGLPYQAKMQYFDVKYERQN